jgi:large subunit ribosomal protein L6
VKSPKPMSRVGKKPIIVPAGVEVSIENNNVTVKGPKGALSRQINEVVTIEQKENEIIVSVENELDTNERAQWGTARAVIANLVKGVTEGFSKKLEVNGVGYRVNLTGRTLVLNVGYSHEVKFDLPEGIEALVEGNLITISGANTDLVGEIAANIRSVRKPEPYKGKGIKYIDEVIRRKAGKAAKASE